jgi:Bacterial PH domain
MFHILRDDAYLAIRTDGVVFRSPARETLLLWNDIAKARWDEAQVALVLEAKEGEDLVVPRRFSGITGPVLAEKVERARRRASLGMLERG